jgi:hypothetical protein
VIRRIEDDEDDFLPLLRLQVLRAFDDRDAIRKRGVSTPDIEKMEKINN